MEHSLEDFYSKKHRASVSIGCFVLGSRDLSVLAERGEDNVKGNDTTGASRGC